MWKVIHTSPMSKSTIKERDRGLKRTEIIHTVPFVVLSAKGPISSCHGEPSIIHPSIHNLLESLLSFSETCKQWSPNRASPKLCSRQNLSFYSNNLWIKMNYEWFCFCRFKHTFLLVMNMSKYHEWIWFWAHELLLLCKFALLLTLLLMFSYLLTSIISRFSSIYTCSLRAKDHSKRRERKLLHRVQFCKEWTLTLAQKSEWITSPKLQKD